uniref:Histone deacetylase domain-containing protein n=1 Tax=Phytophthora ramorum TaxID=164328 RepID=H3HBY4_PHYRM
MLVVSTPEAFEDVLKNQFMNFPKGPHVKENLQDLLGDGIFAADGVKWAHQRDVARGLFRMRELRDCMTEAITRHTKALHDVLGKVCARNRSVDLHKLLSCFSTEAFAEISFGMKMGCLRANKELPFQAAFDSAQRLTAQRFRVLSQRALVPDDGAPKSTNMLSLFLDTIAKSPKAEEQLYDPAYLRDVVVNFLVAGRDTTAQALSWFFYNVSQNPHVEAKLRREIYKKLPELVNSEVCVPTLQQVNRLVYLEAVMKETLRLYPPVPMSPKYAVRDAMLSDGTFVAAGSMVCLPMYAMGRMPHVWGPDAAEFNPERWIDPATKKIVSVSAFKFVAFNAGPRMCLGTTLAGLELKLVAASLLSRFHIHVENPEDVTHEFSLTLPVKGPMNRERMTLALLQAIFPDGELSQHLQLLAPTMATRGEIEAFHTRDYVDVLYEFGGGDDLVEKNRLSSARKRENERRLEEFGLVDDAYVFPGLGRMSRLLVVDIDVHHGDGTQEAFYYSEKVAAISFHLREPGFFPGTGADTEIGAGRGKCNNVNVPQQRGVTDSQFRELFQRVVGKAVETMQPEMLVLVCGVDTLARDPLGGFNLTSDGICDCVEFVMALQLPVLLLGAGGYSGVDACKTFSAIVATVIGQRRNLPDDIPEHDFYEE